MTEKSKKYLSGILMAIERQLVIIGEALNHFQKLEPHLENDKQIVDFRNRLVHAYDSLDNSII